MRGALLIAYCSHFFTREVSTSRSLLISRNVHDEGLLREIECTDRLWRLRRRGDAGRRDAAPIDRRLI